ncbi:MAG: tRNA pseudouridine(38-40) synthase TruA [Terrimesophilobacter sp.]
METAVELGDGDTSASTRLRLDIAYDGTNFKGWGRQPGLRTVQGVLEDALATVFGRFGEPPRLTVAGRTDAGVHALGQVAHLDITAEQQVGLRRSRPRSGPAALAHRLNGIAGLDTDVWVSRSSIAPPGFDARFSAIWRRYEFRVADEDAERNPLERNGTLWLSGALDAAAMKEAAQALRGLHDWASFCKSRDGATSVRTLQDFSWERSSSGVLIANVKADAFCHSMVRALVGATIAVGQGKLTLTRLLQLRDERQRTSEFKVMPAKGLTLMEVGYPADAGLAERAEQTRARREPLDGGD